MAEVMKPFCTYSIECFEYSLRWFLCNIHFARVFSSNSRDVFSEEENLWFSSHFLAQNGPAMDIHFTRVLPCTLRFLGLCYHLASSILLGFAFWLIHVTVFFTATLKATKISLRKLVSLPNEITVFFRTAVEPASAPPPPPYFPPPP